MLYLRAVNSNTKHTPVFIAGAGPSGASAALKLNTLGIPCIIIDKATFPRDKICGDALSGKVIINLKRIDPDLLERFYESRWKTGVWGIRFVAPNNKVIEVPFSKTYDPEQEISPGFVARRTDFDNFLAQELKRCQYVTFIENCALDDIQRIGDGFSMKCSNGETYETPMFLDGMGAHSPFSRKYAGLTKRDAHHAAALRAYYKGVEGFHEHNFIELHFLGPIIPGYFWVFPLPDGHANIGIGMRTDYLKKKKVNLNRVLQDLVASHPVLKDRFKNAELTDTVKGFGLPLGSKLRPISGDHFMLLGDAGHLIDPLTGEGIGHGIYSGVYAAEQIETCMQTGDYSARILKDYDKRIKRVIGKEMKLSYRLQQMMSRAWLVNFLANLVVNHQHFNDVISRMYTDLELRKQLVKPMFWLKLIVLKRL